jgi:hypothetical protein
MMEIIEEKEKRRRRRDLIGKIIGGIIVFGGLFLIFGQSLADRFILPFQYVSRMSACLDRIPEQPGVLNPPSPEARICTCADDSSIAPDLFFKEDPEVKAWNIARTIFIAKAKREERLSDKVLVCEVRDMIDKASGLK